MQRSLLRQSFIDIQTVCPSLVCGKTRLDTARVIKVEERDEEKEEEEEEEEVEKEDI